jgi:hypothetical protein
MLGRPLHSLGDALRVTKRMFDLGYNKLRNRLLLRHFLMKSRPHFCKLIPAPSFAVFSEVHARVFFDVPSFLSLAMFTRHRFSSLLYPPSLLVLLLCQISCLIKQKIIATYKVGFVLFRPEKNNKYGRTLIGVSSKSDVKSANISLIVCMLFRSLDGLEADQDISVQPC